MKFLDWFFETAWKYSTSNIYIWIGLIVSYIPYLILKNLSNSKIVLWLLLPALILFIYGHILTIYTIRKVNLGDPPKSIAIFHEVIKYFPRALLISGIFWGLLLVFFLFFVPNNPNLINSVIIGFLSLGDIRFLVLVTVFILGLLINCYYIFILADIIVFDNKGVIPLWDGLASIVGAWNQITFILLIFSIVGVFYTALLADIFSRSLIGDIGLVLFALPIDICYVILYLSANNELDVN